MPTTASQGCRKLLKVGGGGAAKLGGGSWGASVCVWGGGGIAIIGAKSWILQTELGPRGL